ncbi:Uncharacterised protein [Mycobacterium tuberculosis]|uniref:Uncharacterized protein n=1 Tax=Mycobacterium tuberculosis TaxID=1773 RepID=A0A916LES4_MYCTX|nr:Uncharacterised protein [Mycobacterium tuberculosis]
MVAGCNRRRLWWRAFGHGSGKKTRTPHNESGAIKCCSTSTALPRISRMLIPSEPTLSIAQSS